MRVALLHGLLLAAELDLVGTALGVRDEQRPGLVDAVAPLGDIVAVETAVGLVLAVRLHQFALAAHRLLAVLPGVVEVRQIDQQADERTRSTGCGGLAELGELLLAQRINQVGHHHGQHNEQIVIGHLHVVGKYLHGGEKGGHHQAR